MFKVYLIFLQEIILNNSFFKINRGKLSQITFPPIVPTGPTSHHADTPKHVTGVTTMRQMPSESNCKSMLESLTHGNCKAISCSLGTFDKSAVRILLNVHAIRDVAAEVKQEKRWLKQALQPPNAHCVLPNDCLDEYERLIFDNSEGRVVLNRTIIACDLAALTGSN